eukprot:817974-Rhodomonas_salina.2
MIDRKSLERIDRKGLQDAAVTRKQECAVAESVCAEEWRRVGVWDSNAMERNDSETSGRG